MPEEEDEATAAPEVKTDEKNSRADFHIAIIAAVAALAGSLVGGVFSYVATVKQVEGQSENSQRNFLNTQRQAAYSKLLTDQASMGDELESIYARAKADPTYTMAALQSDLDAVSLLDSTLSLDATNVEVIGSESAAELARQIHKSRLDGVAAISVLSMCYATSKDPAIGLPNSPCASTLDVLKVSLDSTEEEVARLVKAARTDLGVAEAVG